MSKILSDLLGAPEPAFSLALRRLEAVNGRQARDIRLTSDVNRVVRRKLKGLGLDPDDSMPEEIYHALAERFRVDNARLEKLIKSRSGKKKVNACEHDLVRLVNDLPIAKSTFAMKPTTLRRLLTQLPPKRAMKKLGYRSVSSMLKTEQPVNILAAARLAESAAWQHDFVNAYKKLTPADFEVRDLKVFGPDSARWQKFAESVVSERRNNVAAVNEFGAVVLLPLPEEHPPLTLLTTLVLTLHALNEVRAAGSFMKLNQVKSDFGKLVKEAVLTEPRLDAEMLTRPVGWHLVQQYFSRMKKTFKEEIFGPLIQEEDMTWHSIEKVLSFIEPSFEFWHHTSHLGVLHGHAPVSFNIIDVAVNTCNELTFEQRLAQHFRRSLFSELVLKYLKQDNIEQILLPETVNNFAYETALT